ncbi:GTPase-activating protein GYP5 [Phytophthora cinnamomi]|uniref:GTPase-activating protein GYP5 n=1 Tax=Phytophthora cinnamomi TaxID=4785 RepID=UPI003559DF08|nr:GTPase-activating protein GYP5 [Phytophthora cinnamomi]
MAPKDASDACAGDDVSAQQQQQQQLQTPKSSSTGGSTTTTTVAPAPASPERRKKRQRSSSVASDCEASPKKTKKRLRWSTITVHEFGVGLGGSSVPGKGGPSIGLSDKPEFTWTTKVGQMAECVEGVHRFTPEERVRLLQGAGVSEGMILRFSREANIINCSRRRTLVEDIAERKAAKKQRTVESPRPCSSAVLDRPRMIPVNYV